jgi:isoquinoline 1-oxidoreductase subunit alpha
MIEFELNGQLRQLDIDADVPLLWALREELNMTGTKFGCGQGLCGACTVHIDGNAMRSCVTPVGIIAGRKITTIEGISANAEHPVQQAWIEENVVQCGYCQPGQIMSACALLAQNANPSDDDINAAMSGNICRCGTYPRIRKAIHRAAAIMAQAQPPIPQASAVQPSVVQTQEVVRHA